MKINAKEYAEKLGQFVSGEISKEEWIAYCQSFLDDIMDENKEVYIRMKERGD